MGLGQSIVSELNLDSLKVNHPTPSAIVQPMSGGAALWYVVYRFIMALYMVVTLVSGLVSVSKSSMENLSYLHFPVWGYFAGTVQSLLLAFSTLANYYTACKTMSEATTKRKEKHRRSTSESFRRRRMTFSSSLPKMPQAYVIIWVVYYIMLYSSLMTLIMYETKLFRGRLRYVVPNSHIITPSQVLLHQVFFAYCLLDFCLCGIPIRLLHFYVMTTYAIVYQLTLLIVTLIIKKKFGERYSPIYNAADVQFNRLAICCTYFVGFAFITPVAVHIIYYCLFLLKSHLVELYYRTNRATKNPNREAANATGLRDEYGAERAGEGTPGALRSSKIMPISEQEEAEINSLNKEQSQSNNSIALVDFK